MKHPPEPPLVVTARATLDRFDPLPLECDGFTRVAAYAMTTLRVKHRVMGGYVETPQGVVQPHFWLVLDAGETCDELGEWVVDYRLRMWAGPNMPHGVFRLASQPAKVAYHGEETSLECSRFIFEVLTCGVGAELLARTGGG